MRAMGCLHRRHGSIRFSLSRYTTEQEVDTVVEHMPRIIDRLRQISPFVGGTEWHGTPLPSH